MSLATSRRGTTVSVLRQGTDVNREVTTNTDWSAGTAGGYSGGIIILVGVHTTYVSDDPAFWVANSFAQALRNAGYQVQTVESVGAAQTPVVIVATLGEVSVEPDSFWSRYDVKNPPKCNVELHLTVKVLVRGEPRIERIFAS